jgi:hypothetical protein
MKTCIHSIFNTAQAFGRKGEVTTGTRFWDWRWDNKRPPRAESGNDIKYKYEEINYASLYSKPLKAKTAAKPVPATLTGGTAGNGSILRKHITSPVPFTERRS